MTASVIHCDLMVIGSGMAGLAAALFSSNRGVSTVLVGNTGSMRFASGLIDLMSVYPLSEGTCWRDPWAAINCLSQDIKYSHPYSRIKPDDIENAIHEFLTFLSESGISYHTNTNFNMSVITSAGTIKQTFGVPQTMIAGVKAFEDKIPCLLVGFPELKGFSSRQIQETLGAVWPSLRSVDIRFPENFNELFPEQLALELETASCREKVVEKLLPHVKDFRAIGLPAVLGIQRSSEVHSDLERRLGVPIFEIPMLPPSIPGLRLKTAFEKNLPKRGVLTLFQQQVESVTQSSTEYFIFHVSNGEKRCEVHAKGAILATGRFFSKGLYADRSGIRETLFDLPVSQPKRRRFWHNENFLTKKGHNINLAGLETDDAFHPLNENGQPVFQSLFAAGSILANQDWIRMKCGSGLSIATAYAAVNAFLKQDGYHGI